MTDRIILDSRILEKSVEGVTDVVYRVREAELGLGAYNFSQMNLTCNGQDVC